MICWYIFYKKSDGNLCTPFLNSSLVGNASAHGPSAIIPHTTCELITDYCKSLITINVLVAVYLPTHPTTHTFRSPVYYSIHSFFLLTQSKKKIELDSVDAI